MTNEQQTVDHTTLEHEMVSLVDQGHTLLLENAQHLKQALMDKRFYDNFRNRLLNELGNESDIKKQAHTLAVLEEINVNDTIRIGEPLIETLTHDLQTKAKGEFEFKKGDKNLATALLTLLDEDEDIASFVRDLCTQQQRSGVATPFDYRRLTLAFDGKFKEATVEQWLAYFHGQKTVQLRDSIEIGRSFSSTKAQRYEADEERFLVEHLKGLQSLLDIGGSIGISARHLKELLHIREATVTDARTEEELNASFYGNFERDSEIEYILGNQGDITKHMPTERTFDLVTVNNVLVHIRDKETALVNILPRVNLNGYLVVSGGYNTNPSRYSFMLFQKTKEGLKLIRQYPDD